MKHLAKILLLFVLIIFSTELLQAQPPAPGAGNTEPFAPVPGIGLLIAGAVALGVKKTYDFSKVK